MILVDTSVIIETLRGNAVYKKEFDEIGYQNFSISSITKSELIVGCRSKQELTSLRKDIRLIKVYNVVEEIAELSNELLENYFLSHGLLIPDSLIAATALYYDLALYTLNKKDFRYISKLKLYVPEK